MPNYPSNKSKSFDRYESKAIPTTQAPSVQAPLDTTGEAIQKAGTTIGNSIQENSVKWMNAVDTIQKTTATANFKSGMADITNRAQNDPSYNNSDQYFKEIEKLKTDNLKGFASKTAETQTAIDFGYEANVGQIQIKNLYKKKMIDVGQTKTLQLIDTELSKSTAQTPQNIQKILGMSFDPKTGEMLATPGGNLASGIFSHEDAYKIYKKSLKTMGEFDVSNDMSTQESQSSTLAELRKGEKGKYAEIPTDERLDLIKATQQRIFNNNQTFKRDAEDSSNLRSNALIDKFASGEATIKDIENEQTIPEVSGGIKRSQLLTYQRAILSGIKGNLDRMLQEKTPDKKPTERAEAVKKYLDLINNFVDDKTDQWKAKELLAESYADGIINSKEQQVLNGIKQNLKDIEFNRSSGPVATVIKGFKDFFQLQTNASDEDIARNIKTLVGAIATGQDPHLAARKILQQEIIKMLPDISTYPDTGLIKRDANGNKIKIYPDGTYEDVPIKGKPQ